MLSVKSRALSSIYSYLPTAELRSSVRDEFLRVLAAERRPLFAQMNVGRLFSGDDGSEQVLFDLEAGHVVRVGLIVEDGQRYVAALEFLDSPDTSN